jgi:Predicted membrane protein
MKLIIVTLFSLGYFFSIPNQSNIQSNIVSDEKQAAFEVLVKKCNVCHFEQKRNRIFTLENMDKYAKKINKSVFVRKRMPPKNAVITLTEEDKIILKNWLEIELAK